MKVHVTLVGGQPAPVYNGIVGTNPDKIVFVYSEGTEDNFHLLRSFFEDKCIDGVKLDPVDPVVISAVVADMVERYANDSVSVNISSGPKPWAYFFSVQFSKCPNAEIVYMDQNNVLRNYTTMTTSVVPFNIVNHFALYGNSLDHSVDFNEYTSRDKDAAFRLMSFRLFDVRQFNNLLSLLSPENKDKLSSRQYGEFRTTEGSFVSWDKEKQDGMSFVKIKLVKKSGQSKTLEINSEHAVELAFNSGWFEALVAFMLRKWEHSRDVILNCRFHNMQNLVKNEVDIMIGTESRVLFVECKTQLNKITDIDKFASVVATYGGKASSGMFITLANMKGLAIEKCLENDILPFSFNNANATSITHFEYQLFKALDDFVFQIKS